MPSTLTKYLQQYSKINLPKLDKNRKLDSYWFDYSRGFNDNSLPRGDENFDQALQSLNNFWNDSQKPNATIGWQTKNGKELVEFSKDISEKKVGIRVSNDLNSIDKFFTIDDWDHKEVSNQVLTFFWRSIGYQRPNKFKLFSTLGWTLQIISLIFLVGSKNKNADSIIMMKIAIAILFLSFAAFLVKPSYQGIIEKYMVSEGKYDNTLVLTGKKAFYYGVVCSAMCIGSLFGAVFMLVYVALF